MVTYTGYPQRDEGDETPEPQSLTDIGPRLATLEYERAHGHYRTDGEDMPGRARESEP